MVGHKGSIVSGHESGLMKLEEDAFPYKTSERKNKLTRLDSRVNYPQAFLRDFAVSDWRGRYLGF